LTEIKTFQVRVHKINVLRCVTLCGKLKQIR
jgi:hypothetical protein